MARNTNGNTEIAERSGGDALAQQAASVVTPATTTRRNQAISQGTLLRQIVTLKEGDSLDGLTVVGPGAPVDVKSPDGEMSACKTWDLMTPLGFKIGILGSHQLDTEMAGLVGHRIYLERGESKSVGSRRVNQYIIVDLDTPMA